MFSGTYRAVAQRFSVGCRASSLAHPIGLNLKPNLYALGATLTGNIKNLPKEEKYTIAVFTPAGNIVYSNEGADKNFTLNKTFAPGVYYVKVKGKTGTTTKKIVVVN